MMALKHYNKNKKLKKGYSLIEIIISLAIMGFAITVMFSFLILCLQVSISSLSRSLIREEVSSVSGLIARDIRNADYVVNCGDKNNPESCEVIQNGSMYQWSKCDSAGVVNATATNNTSICKFKVEANNVKTIMSITSSTLLVQNFEFSLGYTDSTSDSKTNIIVLINASHSNSNYNIKNIIRQTSVSTRNF